MTTDSDALIPLLTFRWGEETYAVPLAAVREVARPGRLTPVPGESATLVGATVLHGDILPVADVRGMLGLAADPGPMSDACVIVIKERSVQGGPGEPVGLLVDAIREVWQAPEDSLEKVSQLLAGQAHADDGSVVNVLDVPQVLAAL
jgi:purine-binding chemotaxis protein CheW